MKKVFLIFLLVTITIGFMPKPEMMPIVDKELNEYLTFFVQSAEINKTELKYSAAKVTLQFKPTSFFKNTKSYYEVGLCRSCKNSKDSDCIAEVYINKDYWKTASRMNKRLLMFHELGHCLMFKSHDDRIDLAGEPISIMNSALINTSKMTYYNETTTWSYEQELFTGLNPTMFYTESVTKDAL